MEARARPALVAAALVAVSSGCATILGGLDEAHPSSDAGPEAADDDDADPSPPIPDAACAGRLAGFAYRAPIHVTFDGLPVTAFQVPLVLDTAALVTAGKMRADGADLRVTLADGVTPVPHWIESGMNTAQTTLWMRMDLRGDADAWIHYGAPNAEDESSLVDTFVPAVVNDPFFETNTAWAVKNPSLERVAPTSSTNDWSATLAGGKATMRMTRKGAPNGESGGLCQTLLLPPGSMYRFIVDIDVALADHAGAYFWSPNFDWPTHAGPATITKSGPLETRPFPAGRVTVCFGVGLGAADVGQAAEVSFSRPRVRRVVNADAFARVGPEEGGCP